MSRLTPSLGNRQFATLGSGGWRLARICTEGFYVHGVVVDPVPWRFDGVE